MRPSPIAGCPRSGLRVTAIEAHNGAIVACAATAAIDAAFGVVALQSLGPFHAWIHAVLVVQAVVLGAWLIGTRDHPSVGRSDAVFVFIALPHLLHAWLGAQTMVALGLKVDPFMPTKMVDFALALLAPGRLLLGAGLIVLSCAQTIALWHSIGGRLAGVHETGEPWLTLLYASVALGCLATRWHVRVLADRVAGTRARADTLAGMAERVSKVRDRLRGPLEILESAARELEDALPEDHAVAPMRRAAARLRELSSTLEGTASRPITPAAGEAHSRALAGCIISAALEVGNALVGQRAMGARPVLVLYVGHAIFAGAIGLWLWSRRDRPSARASDAAFVSVIAPYFPIAWIAAHVMNELHVWIDPLLPSKLRALAIALLVPSSLRVGAILLLVNTVVSLALAQSLRASGAAFGWYFDEPWLTLLFAGLGFVLLAFRRRARSLDEALARERARSNALTGLARLVSAVRDRANTPLQTLELGLALLGESRPDLVEPMRAALADSREAWATLTVSEREEGHDQTSPDLEQELGRL